MIPTSVKILLAVGGFGMLIGTSLFIRMAIELNRTLPPQKKFYIIELREHFHEVKNLHEKAFPVSTLRSVWFVITVASVITMAAGFILAVKPK
jgi:hypothetical protein